MWALLFCEEIDAEKLGVFRGVLRHGGGSSCGVTQDSGMDLPFRLHGVPPFPITRLSL